MSLSWNKKGTFFIILECFLLFSTMVAGRNTQQLCVFTDDVITIGKVEEQNMGDKMSHKRGEILGITLLMTLSTLDVEFEKFHK